MKISNLCHQKNILFQGRGGKNGKINIRYFDKLF